MNEAKGLAAAVDLSTGGQAVALGFIEMGRKLGIPWLLVASMPKNLTGYLIFLHLDSSLTVWTVEKVDFGFSWMFNHLDPRLVFLRHCLCF